uniref:Interleukin-33 n=1 Tax=Oryctolagus cuniculus TaxID=9986 RepID=G1T660_RABIT
MTKTKYATIENSRARQMTSGNGLVKPAKLRNKVLLRYYESPYSSSESGDGVDGKMLMVNMSPTNDAHLLLHANKKKHSVEFHRYENRLSDLAFFVVHKESSECVSFECKSHRGTYLGVKDNHLGLIQGKNPGSENILFKLST